MSARIPPGFAELWIRFNTPGDLENMYCAVGIDLAPGESGTQTLAETLDTTAEASLVPMLSNQYTVGGGHVIFGQDGGDIRFDSASTPTAGGQTGAGLPPNTAVLARKLTATGGRRGRGRMFIPGIPEGNVGSDGQLVAAYRTTAQTAVADMMADLVALPQVDGLVLLHDTAPFTPTPITGFSVELYVATQRRRLRP